MKSRGFKIKLLALIATSTDTLQIYYKTVGINSGLCAVINVLLAWAQIKN